MASGYLYAGLRIRSDIELPEWSGFEFNESINQFDVRFICLPAQLLAESVIVANQNELILQISETARYIVRDGKEIEITPAVHAKEREIRLFLLGSGWGALCYQRGLLAIHASVVQFNGQCIAFCGASGAGKSTLAASLVQQGGSLISDDLTCIQFFEGKAWAFPAAPRLKLWRSALDQLGLAGRDLEPDHFRLDKFHLTQSPTFRPGGPVCLDVVCILSWGETKITRLRGFQAVNRLIASATYRPDILEKLGFASAHWERCLKLAQTTVIYQYVRPQNWSQVINELIFLT